MFSFVGKKMKSLNLKKKKKKLFMPKDSLRMTERLISLMTWVGWAADCRNEGPEGDYTTHVFKFKILSLERVTFTTKQE